MSRRQSLMLGAGALALGFVPSRAPAAAADVILRPIPHSGEKLPSVGLGTARVFDVGTDAAKRSELEAVISALVTGGGSVIDTSSDYGSAEAVMGDLVETLGVRPHVFIATKIRSGTDAKTARAEFERSLQRLKTDNVDLLQLHNVSRANESLAQLREWKAQKLCRYVGVTSTYAGDYGAMEAIIRREKPDFVQVAYSLGEREAEKRIIPACVEIGAGILTALPLGRSSLFRAVKDKPLPDWAQEFDVQTWAQFFLKFLIGNTAVTVVIPGTDKAGHMNDNLAAGRGRLPDEGQRAKMVEFWQSLN
ncbi:MAG: aldo/keto reductase [Hyphomicrobiales bacterium]|nr:aldo/keto reductase [Hyphomicrobiales bacterium]